MLLDNLNNDFLLGHGESSMLRNFVSSEDCSSYATADEGNESLQDHSRTCLNNCQAMDKTYEGTESGRLDEPAGNVPVAQQIIGETARQKAVKSRFREDFKEINKAKHLFPFMEKITFPIFGRTVSGSRTTDESLPNRIMPGAWVRVPADDKRQLEISSGEMTKMSGTHTTAHCSKDTIRSQTSKLSKEKRTVSATILATSGSKKPLSA